jgi:hypothetical protein
MHKVSLVLVSENVCLEGSVDSQGIDTASWRESPRGHPRTIVVLNLDIHSEEVDGVETQGQLKHFVQVCGKHPAAAALQQLLQHSTGYSGPSTRLSAPT